MPIENKEIDGVEYLYFDFGYGDIRFAGAEYADEILFVFYPAPKPSEIGTKHPEDVGKTLEGVNAQLIFHFKTTESIDALILSLQEHKQEIIDMAQ
jgi:hypothetical protein